ncbi:MAG: RNB domain-containing ribonuclease [Treponema sp.]|nr:RNB domain-containing ribonuclease [Treponema sp.]
MYKNRPCLVKDTSGDKITIETEDGREIRVREKDFEIIHPGPAEKGSWERAAESGESLQADDGVLRETWELLAAEGDAVILKALAELVFGEFSPASAWAAWLILNDGLYFSGTISDIIARKPEDVETELMKRRGKNRESGEREQFLDAMRLALKQKPKKADAQSADTAAAAAAELAGGRRFIQDVEALALGQSVKSKTMKDLGLSETPEDAHALLLNAGFWTVRNNPHPARFGLSLNSAKAPLSPPPPDEPRRDLTSLVSLAIDNAWTNDPDDALSVEEIAGKRILYVHTADIASSIRADSPAEKEARDHGVTLYLPEGNVWMLSEESIPLFGLGLQNKSPALTFRITLTDSCEIEDIDIFPSLVKVQRLTYQQADGVLPEAIASTLAVLDRIANQNIRRRSLAGAVNIELPEVRIFIDGDAVCIEPIPPCRSADIVRECMLLAGEAAGQRALAQNLESSGTAAPAFPFVSQEPGDMPAAVPDGYAGSYQLRRCMRPRSVSVKPGRHWGLGLDAYIQVTSPMRRYTDLLAHMQLRAILRNEPVLPSEEVSVRLAAAEAAAQASAQAERASRAHWTMVYLSDKKDSIWDAVALDNKMNRWVFVIPALALETQVSLRRDVRPNEVIKLVLKSVNIPRCEAVFAEA